MSQPSGCQAKTCRAESQEVATTTASRIPEFWKDQPRLWFSQLEAVLAPQKQGDEYKFSIVISKLTKDEIILVSDIITAPPTTGKYATIKERLINCFEESEQQRLQKLLTEMDLGDQKPSHLLRRMQHLGRGTIGNETIRVLWLRLLPVQITTVLAVSETSDLNAISQLADKMMENIKINEVSTVKVNVNENEAMNSILNQLKEMQSEMCAMKHVRQNVRHSTYQHYFPPRQRSRSRSRDRQYCYHHKFQEYATRCIKPCDWKKGGIPQNQGN